MKGKTKHLNKSLTLPVFASNSRYCNPFWRNVTSAPGGTISPLIVLLLIPASYPKAKAECVKPEQFQEN